MDTNNNGLRNVNDTRWRPLAEVRKDLRVRWYRCPVDPAKLRELMRRSDRQGWFQAAGHLALFAVSGTLVFLCWERELWAAFAAALFLHGTIGTFFRGLATHELNHGTVFRTKWLNRLFLYVYALPSWDNPFHYAVSHTYHHRYTLHPEGDREAVLPANVSLRFLLMAQLFTFNFWRARRSLGAGGLIPVVIDTVLAAGGVVTGEWWSAMYADQPQELRKAVWWARAVLLFHAAVAGVAVVTGLWVLPVILSLFPFIGNWWAHFVGLPMHAGLRDNVPDFRKCVRSITLDPLSEFLYWHMNWHTEHHMYAGVPCYNLAKLYREIAADMPEPRTLAAAWREMRQTWKRQQSDPGYQYDTPLPATAGRLPHHEYDNAARSIGELAPAGLTN